MGLCWAADSPRVMFRKSYAARMRVTLPSAWGNVKSGNVSRRFVAERSTRSTRPGVGDSMGDSGGALLCLSGWHRRLHGGETQLMHGGL